MVSVSDAEGPCSNPGGEDLAMECVNIYRV